MWTWIICCRQRTKWRAVVKRAMKSQCLGMRGICGLSEETSAAEEGICSVGLVTKHLRLFTSTAYIVAVFRLKSQLLEQNIEGQTPRWPVHSQPQLQVHFVGLMLVNVWCAKSTTSLTIKWAQHFGDSSVSAVREVMTGFVPTIQLWHWAQHNKTER